MVELLGMFRCSVCGKEMPIQGECIVICDCNLFDRTPKPKQPIIPKGRKKSEYRRNKKHAT